MIAFLFPGQGAQFEGMGRALTERDNTNVDKMMKIAHEILGFDLLEIMVNGTEQELKRTDVTQPALFVQSLAKLELAAEGLEMSAAAGHSLGEFSALVAAGVLPFEEGLELVKTRANAMQHACELTDGTMAAIVGMEDEKVEEVCAAIEDVVVPANYNSPGQIVISGSVSGVHKAVDTLKEAGAKRAILLQVGGAFHSPLMQPAREELASKINEMTFHTAQCPVYQNVDAKPHTDSEIIKQNLLEQLTSPVRWTDTMRQMLLDGVDEMIEVGGNGKVLRGLMRRIDRNFPISAI